MQLESTWEQPEKFADESEFAYDPSMADTSAVAEDATEAHAEHVEEHVEEPVSKPHNLLGAWVVTKVVTEEDVVKEQKEREKKVAALFS